MRRHEVVLRLHDAAVAAACRPKRHVVAELRALIFGSSNFDRVGSLLALVEKLSPGLRATLARRLYTAAHLPMTPLGVSLLAYGSGGTLFRLDMPTGGFVLKIFRRSLGKPLAVQLGIAREYRDKYETVRGWYNRDAAIVPPTHFLVLGSPIGGSPVAAALQPYLGGRKRDALRDFPEHELAALLKSQPVLQRQFMQFATTTRALFAADGPCLDLIGRDNVMVVDGPDGPRLAIVDVGILDMRQLRAHAHRKYAEMSRLVERIQSLLRALDETGERSRAQRA